MSVNCWYPLKCSAYCMKCTWTLFFVLENYQKKRFKIKMYIVHRFSLFPVICSQLPVTRTPDNSNLFLFPLKVRVIGIRLQLFFLFSCRLTYGQDTALRSWTRHFTLIVRMSPKNLGYSRFLGGLYTWFYSNNVCYSCHPLSAYHRADLNSDVPHWP